jgi:hypothetical protein
LFLIVSLKILNLSNILFYNIIWIKPDTNRVYWGCYTYKIFENRTIITNRRRLRAEKGQFDKYKLNRHGIYICFNIDNTYVNRETLKTFSLKSGSGQCYTLSPPLFNIARAIKQEGNKRIQTRK